MHFVTSDNNSEEIFGFDVLVVRTVVRTPGCPRISTQTRKAAEAGGRAVEVTSSAKAHSAGNGKYAGLLEHTKEITRCEIAVSPRLSARLERQ